MKSYEEVNRFWFAEQNRHLWFRPIPAFDSVVRERFASAYQLASSRKLDSWRSNSEGILALIILTDYLPRKMFRGTAQAMRLDFYARELCKEAIQVGLDAQLPKEQRQFIYMPLMHSENINDQHVSVRLFGQIGKTAHEHAVRHRDIIERFGRFPFLNDWLGRESTEEEKYFLEFEDEYTA